MKFVDGHPNGWKNMTRNNTSSYINQFDSSTFLVSYSFATCSIDGVSGKLKFRVASKGELISKKNLNRITKWHESYIISIFYGWGYNEVNNFCIMSFYHNGIISHTKKQQQHLLLQHIITDGVVDKQFSAIISVCRWRWCT